MKKSLLALAVLGAFAGTAAAQSSGSSVVLYGLIDLNISHQTAGDDHLGPDAGDSVTRMDDGGRFMGPGSRWGLRVTEDLGSGMKAGVVLESGFGADQGDSFQGGRLFGRQAFISLTTGFGELRMGRQYTLTDEVVGMTTPYGNTTVLSAGYGYNNAATGMTGGFNIPMFVDNSRTDNTVMYRSPNFGGFEVHGSVALGEAAVPRSHQVRLNYAAGPLAASVVYGWDDAEDFDNKVLTVGANYNFGAFKLLGGFQRARDMGVDPGFGTSQTSGLGTFTLNTDDGPATYEDSQSYTIGVLFPIGNFQLGANYSNVEFDTDEEGDVDVGRFGLGAKYALSKTAYLYSTLAIATGDLKDNVAAERWIQLGMGKAF